MIDALKLRRVAPVNIARESKPPVDRATLDAAESIIETVRERGESGVRTYAEQFGERRNSDPLVLDRAAMLRALDSIDPEDRALLESVAARIERFAQAQRDAISEIDVPIPGGRAGHTIEPIGAAGCYAPGGRYPLPSSALMTAITARVAGCRRVVVASPGANPIMLAAAAIAGADEFLTVGGAHGIGALAYGFEGFDRCDVVVGPGNRWVTAAKQIVSVSVGIDMLAGPSELLVLADDTANPELIAADLLAQAEHDTDAAPMLLTTSRAIADRVDHEITVQLRSLPTRDVAATALRNGFVCVASDLQEAISIADTIAPEHLEIMTSAPGEVARQLRNAGALFIGEQSAEALGDYGAGPNHTLPTGGAARFQAGLSVMHFLRLRTWMRITDPDDAEPLIEQSERLARIEGLKAHSRSASARRKKILHTRDTSP